MLEMQSILWYHPKQKAEEGIMAQDRTGRIIRRGDVCGFASRRGSTTTLDLVIVREIRAEGVVVEKFMREETDGVVVVRLARTKMIRRTDHLVITDLDEKGALQLMRLRRE